VILANDGLDALAKLEDIQPDLIISDINMPEMDGFKFRSKVLKNDIYKDIPFVFLTNRSSEVDTIKGLNLDVDDYIPKTSSPQLVIAKIESTITRRASAKMEMIEELASSSREISAQMVPERPPSIDTYKIVQWHQPHEGVPGGDFIDYIRIDDNRWIGVIGDVMGKRWKAWMFGHAYIGYLRSLIRTQVKEKYAGTITPSVILDKLNVMLFEDQKISDVLCTLMLVLLDSTSDIIQLSSAAHIPALHYISKSKKTKKIVASSPFLGFAKETKYENFTISFRSGDRLLMLTDGITEAESKDQKFFQTESVIRLFQNLADKKVDDIIETFRQTLIDYTEKSNFDDDTTLICIEKQ
jgi:sigma-B regulation protein RsbU (phosphoserine phosphatase)